MRANLRLLRRLYGDSRSLLAIGALAAVGQSALLVPVALLVRRVFDRSIPQHRPGEIAVTGLAVFGLTAASAGLGWLSRRLIVRISKESVGRLRVELMATSTRCRRPGTTPRRPASSTPPSWPTPTASTIWPPSSPGRWLRR